MRGGAALSVTVGFLGIGSGIGVGSNRESTFFDREEKGPGGHFMTTKKGKGRKIEN